MIALRVGYEQQERRNTLGCFRLIIASGTNLSACRCVPEDDRKVASRHNGVSMQKWLAANGRINGQRALKGKVWVYNENDSSELNNEN